MFYKICIRRPKYFLTLQTTLNAFGITSSDSIFDECLAVAFDLKHVHYFDLKYINFVNKIRELNDCFQFLSNEEAEEFERGKRGALDLAQIIKCATGCDPLLFKGYGCFCGYLGSGEPVDGIDT